uniref:Engulfment and cell motility 1 n=1 Tax=Molossus molossus TaxID=27622 RepID=A0A7J8HAN0_MOLMO|nr:engulfment and cell motility 1 [Molossus molossus]
MQVVKEQVMRALTSKPSSLDQFKSKLQNLSYTEILKLRQSERMSQEDFQSRPILELKEKIQPEILELIKQQRLNRLVEGTCFRKLNSRRRQDKFWYCRLSPNHKVLHYGDLEESPQGEVPHDSLQDKLPVADIKAVVTGKDCPHMKEKGALKQNKEVLELAFSILCDSNCQLNFIAPDKHEYCIWTDGLNALLGKDMLSELTRNDLDTLLSEGLCYLLLGVGVGGSAATQAPQEVKVSDIQVYITAVITGVDNLQGFRVDWFGFGFGFVSFFFFFFCFVFVQKSLTFFAKQIYI